MSSQKRSEIWKKMQLKDIERRMLVTNMNYHNEQTDMIKKKIQEIDRELQRLSDKHMKLYL